VCGVVAFAGNFDYVARRAAAPTPLRERLVTYLGGELDENPDTWAQASPITWVDGSEPPFLLIHGLADTTMPPEQSQAFAAALEKAGADVELLLVPDASHDAIMRSEKYRRAVEAFCARL
jgi:dipeptidyl aminopeptidase/acylaminoacyl peptidase